MSAKQELLDFVMSLTEEELEKLLEHMPVILAELEEPIAA